MRRVHRSPIAAAGLGAAALAAALVVWPARTAEAHDVDVTSIARVFLEEIGERHLHHGGSGTGVAVQGVGHAPCWQGGARRAITKG